MVDVAEAEVVIVGAGPAGLAAACCLAEAGKDVLVVDEAARPGGQIWRHRGTGDVPAAGRAWLDRLASTQVRSMTETSVVDVGPDGALVAEGPDGCCEIRGQKVVLATGARELFLPFPGWTLPGVVGVGAGQALVKAGVDVRDVRVVIAGSGPLLLPVAALLRSRGARLELIAEQASLASVARFGMGLYRVPSKILEAVRYRWKTSKVPYSFGVWVVAARGDSQLKEVDLTNGRRTWTEPCDLLCCSSGLVPNTELARLLGCGVEGGRVLVDANQTTSVESIFCVGESTGIGGAEIAVLEGQIAAARIGDDEGRLRSFIGRRRKLERFSEDLERAFQPRQELADRMTPETVVCRCEDVAWGELDPRWSVRQAKLYTRLGMGPCQGRVCGAAVRYLCGWETDTVRPPVEPCRLSSLIRQPESEP